jgi:oligogalacturonide lyase
MQAIPSRRALLAALAAIARAADKPDSAPSEARRFRDSATEFEFTALTDPKNGSAWLPRPSLRAMTSRSNTLVYASDRSGSTQAWRMDLKSLQSRLLTSAQKMDPRTLSVAHDDRSVLYIDAGHLAQTGGRRTRTIYTPDGGWQATSTIALAEDGSHAALVERREERLRMRIVAIGRGTASTILEADEPVRYIRFRPKRPNLLYNFGGTLTVVNLDGRASQRLKIPEGTAGDAHWSADGLRVHYLLTPAEPGRAVQLREHFLETGDDKLIGATTQFVSFSRNSDSSVFVGVSGSKAAPYLLVLLRAARRELTIAEHRASLGSNAAIILSPDSQRVFWETDREGKPAIYTMSLEKFLEKTSEETA